MNPKLPSPFVYDTTDRTSGSRLQAAAINRAHDLRSPFCHVVRRSDGSLLTITPYYVRRLPK